MVELKNEQLSIVVSEKGAELQSIKDASGKEYLWQADPKFWGRHSPILFPIVCSVNGETYRVDGKEYHLPRHGFARDAEFKLIAQNDRKVTRDSFPDRRSSCFQRTRRKDQWHHPS